jgi:hypothetical protein
VPTRNLRLDALTNRIRQGKLRVEIRRLVG